MVLSEHIILRMGFSFLDRTFTKLVSDLNTNIYIILLEPNSDFIKLNFGLVFYIELRHEVLQHPFSYISYAKHIFERLVELKVCYMIFIAFFSEYFQESLLDGDILERITHHLDDTREAAIWPRFVITDVELLSKTDHTFFFFHNQTSQMDTDLQSCDTLCNEFEHIILLHFTNLNQLLREIIINFQLIEAISLNWDESQD